MLAFISLSPDLNLVRLSHLLLLVTPLALLFGWPQSFAPSWEMSTNSYPLRSSKILNKNYVTHRVLDLFFQLRALIWRTLVTKSLRRKGFGPRKGILLHLTPTKWRKQMMMLKKMLSKKCQSGKNLKKGDRSPRVFKSLTRKKAFLKLMKSRKKRRKSPLEGDEIVKRKKFASLWMQRQKSKLSQHLKQLPQNKSPGTKIVANPKRSLKSMKNLTMQRRHHLLLWFSSQNLRVKISLRFLKEVRSSLKMKSDHPSKLSLAVATWKTLQRRRSKKKRLVVFKSLGLPRTITTTSQIIPSAIIIQVIEKALREVNVVVIKTMVADFEVVFIRVVGMIFQFTDLMVVVKTTDRMMATGWLKTSTTAELIWMGAEVSISNKCGLAQATKGLARLAVSVTLPQVMVDKKMWRVVSTLEAMRSGN